MQIVHTRVERKYSAHAKLALRETANLAPQSTLVLGIMEAVQQTLLFVKAQVQVSQYVYVIVGWKDQTLVLVVR